MDFESNSPSIGWNHLGMVTLKNSQTIPRCNYDEIKNITQSSDVQFPQISCSLRKISWPDYTRSKQIQEINPWNQATRLPFHPPPPSSQEWPRQTKPKKGQFMNFSRGAFRNKSSMWTVLVFLRKNTRIHKNGRNSWTFRFGPFFGLVCRGDSWLFLQK